MFLWGCGSPKTSEEISSEEYIESYTQDTIVFPPEYMQVQSEEHIAQIDSQRKRGETEKDSISEIEESKLVTALKELSEKINSYTLQDKPVPDSLTKRYAAVASVLNVDGKVGKNIPVDNICSIWL